MTASPRPALAPPWPPPPERLVLAPDEVHLWRTALDFPPAQLQSLRHSLAADEAARAERCHFERDRRHFIAARGVLRALLGRYLGQAPAAVRFSYGAQGKPALADGEDAAPLHFNLSHAHGVALYAFTRGREVGIDLERLRGDLAATELAQRFFCPGEAAMIQGLAPPARPRAFLRCWTRKEACLKGLGAGLSLPLNQFAVITASGTPTAPAGWWLLDLEPAPGYLGALALAAPEGAPDGRLACWHWPGAPWPPLP